MIGDKKGVYHSALVKEGPVTVTITCDGPIASKYSGQADYVTFRHEGYDHTLAVENDAIGEALTGWKGQTVTLEASGRAENAEILVSPCEEQDAPPPRQSRNPTRPPQRPAQHQPAQQQRQPAAKPHGAQPPHRLTPEEKAEKERKAFAAMKIQGAKVAVCLRASFLHAQNMLSDLGFKATDFSFEDLRAVAITHFIETKSTTDIHALPHRWLDKEAAPKQQAPTPPEPEPEPEPEEELEPDDIVF